MIGDRVMVGGRYELGDLLGRGGMAKVHRAVDTRLGRPVAVKRLRADLAADSMFQARFRREAQSAAGLVASRQLAYRHPRARPAQRTGLPTPRRRCR
jgi:hypothetical protein